MNVSILSLCRHSDPGEIFSATVRIKVQLVANPVTMNVDQITEFAIRSNTLAISLHVHYSTCTAQWSAPPILSRISH